MSLLNKENMEWNGDKIMTVSYNKLKMLFFYSSKSNSVYVKFREIKGGIIKNGKI